MNTTCPSGIEVFVIVFNSATPVGASIIVTLAAIPLIPTVANEVLVSRLRRSKFVPQTFPLTLALFGALGTIVVACAVAALCHCVATCLLFCLMFTLYVLVESALILFSIKR